MKQFGYSLLPYFGVRRPLANIPKKKERKNKNKKIFKSN